MLNIPLICLGGPTGAGKSAAAIRLAQALNGAVVNADSRQVYRDFQIITAQPDQEEMAQAPHRLYGFLSPEEKISAGRYARLAREEIARLGREGRLPVITGGTGLYFQALLGGLADIPPVPDVVHARWQECCALEGSERLHALLVEQDPSYAAKIHPRDRQRITRALEIMEATGKPFSQWHAEQAASPGFNCLFFGLGLPLPELEPLLRERIDWMLENGALQEARAALAKYPNPAAPGWSGIGCAELRGFLTNEISLDEARELWLRNTRAYAKRQITWFKARPGLIWRRPEQTGKIIDEARAWLQKQPR